MIGKPISPAEIIELRRNELSEPIQTINKLLKQKFSGNQIIYINDSEIIDGLVPANQPFSREDFILLINDILLIYQVAGWVVDHKFSKGGTPSRFSFAKSK